MNADGFSFIAFKILKAKSKTRTVWVKIRLYLLWLYISEMMFYHYQTYGILELNDPHLLEDDPFAWPFKWNGNFKWRCGMGINGHYPWMLQFNKWAQGKYVTHMNQSRITIYIIMCRTLYVLSYLACMVSYVAVLFIHCHGFWWLEKTYSYCFHNLKLRVIHYQGYYAMVEKNQW